MNLLQKDMCKRHLLKGANFYLPRQNPLGVSVSEIFVLAVIQQTTQGLVALNLIKLTSDCRHFSLSKIMS